MQCLFIGLGNPGNHYKSTPHNVGFMIIDAIGDHFKFPTFKNHSNYSLSNHNIFETKIILLKPMTFMNNSGNAVSKIIKLHKISLDDVIVFHDDIDLKLGIIKIKKGGGSAGHNGLKSIDSFVGSNYWRVRFGVGRPENKDDVSNYVLSKFHDLNPLITPIQNIVTNLQILLTENKSLLMNKINILY